jgi:hypothetical protein
MIFCILSFLIISLLCWRSCEALTANDHNNFIYEISISFLAYMPTSVNENQLMKDLFTQTLEERKLKRIWPEDLLDEV